jgi:hypothetical protein
LTVSQNVQHALLLLWSSNSTPSIYPKGM